MFGSEFFAGNRARLRELFTGTAPIVLTANGLVQRGGDTSFPFAQDASFWYLTGCENPDVVLVLDKDKEYLIVPSRGASRVAFDGAVDETELVRISGIQTVYDDAEGWRRLSTRLEKVKHVATLASPAAYVEQLGLYVNPARRQLITKIKSYNEQLELLDIGQHLMRMRAVKQPTELAAIQSAIDITARSLKTVLQAAKRKTYSYEYEVEAELTRAFRKAGASGHAFDPIVAGGARACTLHYLINDHALSSDELLLCDVGAEVKHYAADVTRTVALGTPTRRQEMVYDAVLEVQAYATSLLRPSVILKEYEEQVGQFMGEKLRELGLIKTIEPNSLRQFYPHATSHFLGLNAHDVGAYDQPLEPGIVLTVEPGIYIRNESIGIRIEDDLLITPTGNQILSADLPKTLV